jgi:energy-converting hydrogenase A subunit M
MTFVYYMLAIAVLLLTNIKRIESVSLQYKTLKEGTPVNHSHNLIIDLGDVLMNKEGIEQYEALKPKFEQVKRYCLNVNNQQVNRIINVDESQFEPVKLKIVS